MDMCNYIELFEKRNKKRKKIYEKQIFYKKRSKRK